MIYQLTKNFVRMSILDDIDAEIPDIIEGQKYHIHFFEAGRSILVHVRHIVPGYYQGQRLIIFSFFGMHKRWWHDKMLAESDFKFSISMHNKNKTL